VLLIFNCPELIATDPCTCAAAKPKAVLIVSDGPRASRPDDKINCAEVRKTLQEGIDWEAKVMANFSEQNLACRELLGDALRRGSRREVSRHIEAEAARSTHHQLGQ
jgi:hypothetical protein